MSHMDIGRKAYTYRTARELVKAAKRLGARELRIELWGTWEDEKGELVFGRGFGGQLEVSDGRLTRAQKWLYVQVSHGVWKRIKPFRGTTYRDADDNPHLWVVFNLR